METIRRGRDGTDAGLRKPVGGFVFITGTALLSAWWAYRQGLLTRLDLRVWLACFEAVARRYGLRTGRTACYTTGELRILVGGNSDDEIRRSLRRLTAVGLVDWSEGCVRVGSPCRLDSETQQEYFQKSLSRISNHYRRVPVPRRVMRFLCRSGTRVLLATMFGHLLRCCYYRAGQCRPTGICKASWIADVFGVDARNVKGARRELAEQGILLFERVGQKFLNHYGPLITVNLEWEPPTRSAGRIPPPGGHQSDGLPPPIRNSQLLRNFKNQNRASGRRPGIEIPAAEKPPANRPSFGHVVEADLTDPVRLSSLYEQACAAGHVQRCASDRLNFFAAAVHARVVGTRNPAGLFASIVRQQRWSLLTLADEDRARWRANFLPVNGGRHSRIETRPMSIGEVLGQIADVKAADWSGPLRAGTAISLGLGNNMRGEADPARVSFLRHAECGAEGC